MAETCKTKEKPKPTTIEDLSDELLVEILYRLPYHFILQCKSITKRFLRVISDPFFLRQLPHHRLPRPFEMQILRFPLLFNLYTNFCTKKMLLCVDSKDNTFILNHSSSSSFLPCFGPEKHDRVTVQAIHYDLILCTIRSTFETKYFICNPLTKQWVALPPIPLGHLHELARVGFIYDQSHSRFRVVRILFSLCEYASSFQVNVFSSETCEWAVSTVTIPRDVLMSHSYPKNAVVYNGMLLWWIKELGFLVCDPFNGWDSMWRFMPGPCYCMCGESDIVVYNGLFDGRLKICTFLKKESKLECWKLQNFESGTWSFDYIFYLKALFSHEPCRGLLTRGCNKNIRLLALHPLYEDMIYLYLNGYILLYDIGKRKLKSVSSRVDVDDQMPYWENVMCLVLPGWPTLVPTFDAVNP